MTQDEILIKAGQLMKEHNEHMRVFLKVECGCSDEFIADYLATNAVGTLLNYMDLVKSERPRP